jgi:adenine-specific DNA-methyltransferase
MLRDLLADDGSIWISIDDNEGHYLKVMMDEIFGRKNFISNVIWQKKYSPQNDDKGITQAHDHILVFVKDIKNFKVNLLPRTDEMNARYENIDQDPKGEWKSGDLTSKTKAKGHSYPIIGPDGQSHLPSPGRQWAPSEATFQRWLSEGRIWFGRSGNNRPSIKQYLSEVQSGIVPLSIWFRDDVGDNQEAKREITVLNSVEIFETPKPERLIQRVLILATNTGDLVLDSFAGSGTTAAVAHKMDRRYIGIEMGNHAVTHCVPRLNKVIDGEQGGISKDVNWLGGGGFRFYQLGEAIFDEQGHINSKVKFKSLAAHVWFSETHTPLLKTPKTPLLGIHSETALYLLYNGILGDKTPEGGNVLTARVVRELPKHKGKKVIYGEMCMLDEATLQKQEITFKHIPYDIKAR